jgi:hypothetical protein
VIKQIGARLILRRIFVKRFVPKALASPRNSTSAGFHPPPIRKGGLQAEAVQKNVLTLSVPHEVNTRGQQSRFKFDNLSALYLKTFDE